MKDVPLVDFGPALEGSPSGLSEVAAAVDEACRHTGFFYLRNHLIAPELVTRAFDEARAFFALPTTQKLAVSMYQSRNYRGYIPFDAKLYEENRRGAGGSGFQSHLRDEILKDHAPDVSESFQIHRELSLDDPDVLAGKPLHGPNQWPAVRPSMRPTLSEYYEAAAAMAYRMLEVFAICLDLETDFFLRYYHKPLMQLRLMHYPAHPPSENVPFGVRPHCDAGAFTMLVQDDVGGLEVCNKQGEWVFVEPIANTLVVNIGDTMKLWTNNRFESTRHRVINVYDADRISLPFFVNPDYDAVIEPIPTCVDDAHPPVFDVLHCGESLLHTYSRIWPSAPVQNNQTSAEP